MSLVPKLTTVAACRVAGLDRNRFNEHVAAGDYACAPPTVPGRARFFDPAALLTLTLFKRLMDEGFSAKAAGNIACAVGQAAQETPGANVIAYVETFVGMTRAYPADQVPSFEHWEDKLFSGGTIKKVTQFNVAQLRRLIDHYIDEERSIIGADDPDA